MRIAFLGNFLHRRASQGEGSTAHFFGVARGLQKRGHMILLPGKGAKYFPGSLRFSPLYPLALRSVDIAYIRMEGRPVQVPWYLDRAVFCKMFAPDTTIVWEINAAPELLAFDGRHCSPSILRILEDVIKRQARHADAAICNTDGLCQFAHDLGIHSVTAIELATFPDRFQPAHHESLNLEVCWLAGNSRVSWHDAETIAAAVKLLRNDQRIRFHMIGDQTGFLPGRNLTVHGRVTGKDLADLLSKMDVGLAVYRDSLWSRYGAFTSPLKVFDYLAAGLHIVASPIEQNHKLAARGASLTSVPFSDPAALAQALRSTIKDSRFKAGCAQNRRLAEEHYNWERVSDATHMFLQRVVAQRRTSCRRN